VTTEDVQLKNCTLGCNISMQIQNINSSLTDKFHTLCYESKSNSTCTHTHTPILSMSINRSYRKMEYTVTIPL